MNHHYFPQIGVRGIPGRSARSPVARVSVREAGCVSTPWERARATQKAMRTAPVLNVTAIQVNYENDHLQQTLRRTVI